MSSTAAAYVGSTAAAYVESTAAAHVYGTELKRAGMIASAASFTAAYAQRMQQMQLQQQMQMHLMIMHQKQIGAHHERYRGGYVSAELKEDNRKASPFVMRLFGIPVTNVWVPLQLLRDKKFRKKNLRNGPTTRGSGWL